MTNKHYQAGRRKEYALINYLREEYNKKGYKEGKDYIVQRSASSKSPHDIILHDYYDGFLMEYQVKYGNTYSKKELEEYKKLPKIISVYKNFVFYKRGNSKPIFIWEEE